MELTNLAGEHTSEPPEFIPGSFLTMTFMLSERRSDLTQGVKAISYRHLLIGAKTNLLKVLGYFLPSTERLNRQQEQVAAVQRREREHVDHREVNVDDGAELQRW